VALYFGVAALVAALAAALGAGVALQLIVFAIVSVATLVATRGMVTRALQRSPVVRSNVSSLVGRRGVVTVPITSATGRGQIRVGTEYWTARPYMDDASDIVEGTAVEVLSVEGVTALVLPLDRSLTE
jgi:membrane protein implicated in regulation of membrane protease activity